MSINLKENIGGRIDKSNNLVSNNLSWSADYLLSYLDKLSKYSSNLYMNKNFTKIPDNSDLNTVEFLKIGNYYCYGDSSSKTIKNSPTNSISFLMEVSSPISNNDIDCETSKNYIYRVRKITTYEGEIYTQQISSDYTVGNFKYYKWKHFINKEEYDNYYLINLVSKSDKQKNVIIGNSVDVDEGNDGLVIGNFNNGYLYEGIIFNDSDSRIEFNLNSQNISNSVTNTKPHLTLETNEIYPQNNITSLGTSSRKWTNIYASTSTISTSDRRLKSDINNLDNDLIKSFIMGLIPVSYKLIEGESGRTHYGLIAQDVEDLMTNLNMTSLDFAGFIKSPKIVEETIVDEETGKTKHTKKTLEDEYIYSLRYEEFIAPLIKMVQMQQEEIKELNNKIITYENSINEIKKEIEELKKE